MPWVIFARDNQAALVQRVRARRPRKAIEPRAARLGVGGRKSREHERDGAQSRDRHRRRATRWRPALPPPETGLVRRADETGAGGLRGQCSRVGDQRHAFAGGRRAITTARALPRCARAGKACAVARGKRDRSFAVTRVSSAAITSTVASASRRRSVTSRKLPRGVATTYNVAGRARNPAHRCRPSGSLRSLRKAPCAATTFRMCSSPWRSPGPPHSPLRERPPQIARSPSPSKATPRAWWPSTTRRASVSGAVDPQPRLMLRPSGATPMQLTSKPISRNRRGATVAVAPFAQSMAIRIPVHGAPRQDVSQVIEVVGAKIDSSTGRDDSPGTDQDESAMIDSTCRSSVSVNFSPAPENTLMPLSSKGLCEAEMTTPAEIPQTWSEIGNCGRRHHTGARERAALTLNAEREFLLDPGPRLTRVAPARNLIGPACPHRAAVREPVLHQAAESSRRRAGTRRPSLERHQSRTALPSVDSDPAYEILSLVE